MEGQKPENKPLSGTLLSISDEVSIKCNNCGNEIPASNININNSLAKCNHCQLLFNIKKDSFFKNNPRQRPEILMPEGVDILPLNDTLDIRIDKLKSFHKGTLGFLTLFTVGWNLFLSVFVVSMVSSGAYSELLFLSIHLAVGLGLLWYVLGIYLNYTDIIITNRYIKIGHRPIKNPFKPEITIPTADISQLYVSEYVSSTTNGRPNIAYALYAKRKGKDNLLLIKEMNKETQLYLEQEIERYLNIEDANVKDSITE